MPNVADARRRQQGAGFLLILAAALVIGAPGLGSLPIDKHEALVARTSVEMLERDDLVVPYFNDTPRLKKPPLSYWATIGVHRIRAEPGAPLRVIDARIPSLAAMLGVLALIMGLAARAAGPGAALTAGAIAAASPMLSYFAHDARPDALYAFLTFAGATVLAKAMLAPAADHGRKWMIFSVGLGWILWGLATLAKGPHIPLMSAVGLFGFGAVEFSDWREAWRRLRPFSGLALMAATAIPWWWALEHRLDPQVLADSQLGGALYQPGLAALLDSYRELLGVGLLFPWFLLIPIYFREARALFQASPVARLCVWGYLVPLALLLFSPQHRWHYMLPLVPFLAVFCGLLADRLTKRRRFRTGFWSAFLVLVLLLSANSAFQWTWDGIRFDREQHLAPLSEPGLKNVPLAATPSIESAFQVLVATAERPVRLLKTPAEVSAWQAEIATSCGIVLTTEDELEHVRSWAQAKTLATWTEHGSGMTLQIMGGGRTCEKTRHAYRQASVIGSPGAPR